MGKTVSLILRVSLAFAFLYPPLSAFLNPSAWIGYVPTAFKEIDVFGEGYVFLHLFGVFEVLLALWILSGKYIFYPSLCAAVVLIFIVAAHTSEFDVLFRDIPIIGVALALAYLNYPHKHENDGLV